MVMNAYKSALSVLMRKPFVLWGLSLMSGLLSILVSLFCIAVPVVAVPVTLTLTAGMALIYLDGLRGKEVNSDQLFAGFKKFGHVAGGMAWMQLWIFIWSLVPIVGPIIAMVKGYSYAFTPYILMTRPDVSATEALRISMKETNGKKKYMFLAELLFGIAVVVISLVLAIIAIIPVLGALIALLGFVIIIAFSPLIAGLIAAYFYETRHAAPPVYSNAPYYGGMPQQPNYPQYPNGAPQQYGYPNQGMPQRPAAPQQPPVNPVQTAPQRPVAPQAPQAPAAPVAPQQPPVPPQES